MGVRTAGLLVALVSTAWLPRPAAAADVDHAPYPPKWEAGLVLGGGWINDYPGADRNHVRSLVAPFLIYRGPVWRVDRDGIRSRLFANPDLELDLAASAAFNARHSDAREGMPALDYLFGVGPQLVYKGWRQQWGSPELRLKARALVSTDFRHVDGRGAALDAEVRWRIQPARDWPGALTNQDRLSPWRRLSVAVSSVPM